METGTAAVNARHRQPIVDRDLDLVPVLGVAAAHTPPPGTTSTRAACAAG
jgi:hypothetical protein